MLYAKALIRGRRMMLLGIALLAGAGASGQAYPVTAVSGTAPTMGLGRSVAGGGDVDLDGVPDVLIGGTGVVLAVSGATGAVIRTIVSGSGNPAFGGSVSIVGDVDGDGHADILIGARTGFPGNGQSFVYSGATSAVIHAFSYPFSWGAGGSVAGVGDANADGTPDFAVGGSSVSGVVVYSGANGSVLFTVATAPQQGLGFDPRIVAAAGDLNGDGHADILVGLPREATFFYQAGSAAVYSGATGAPLGGITGGGAEFGLAVAALGDVTGDGVVDYLIGAPRVYASLPAAPGYAQVISGASGAIVRALNGNANGDAFGSSVAALGDLDGDGFPDFMVGAPGIGAGYARIFSGRTGEVLLTLAGGAPLDAFGVACAGTGDLNGDGFSEFVVGANGADPAGITDAGRASVLSYAGIPAGSSTFGSGCPGQGGYSPAILTGGGAPTSSGNPSFRILLTRARPSASIALEAGYSSTNWAGIPLPFNLASYGMPACTQLVSPDYFFLGYTTSGGPGQGRAGIPLPIPADPSLSGATGFLQWLVVDPGPSILPGTMSGALQLVVL